MTSPLQSRHIATIGYAARFWDVYVELEEDPQRQPTGRARLSFSPAGAKSPADTLRTSMIILEATSHAAVAKARTFDERQLVALLRSCLPGDQQP